VIGADEEGPYFWWRTRESQGNTAGLGFGQQINCRCISVPCVVATEVHATASIVPGDYGGWLSAKLT
jgi:hypothetical protein